MTHSFATFGPILSLVLMMEACALRTEKVPPLRQTFQTTITSNDLKIFDFVTYSDSPEFARQYFENDKVQRSGNIGIERQDLPSPGEGRTISLKSFHVMSMEQLERSLEETKYCREGYLLLKADLGRLSYRMRGECQEPAGEADRIAFPNTD